MIIINAMINIFVKTVKTLICEKEFVNIFVTVTRLEIYFLNGSRV